MKESTRGSFVGRDGDDSKARSLRDSKQRHSRADFRRHLARSIGLRNAAILVGTLGSGPPVRNSDGAWEALNDIFHLSLATVSSDTSKWCTLFVSIA